MNWRPRTVGWTKGGSGGLYYRQGGNERGAGVGLAGLASWWQNEWMLGMTVTVLYFAALREQSGLSEETVTTSAKTARELYEK